MGYLEDTGEGSQSTVPFVQDPEELWRKKLGDYFSFDIGLADAPVDPFAAASGVYSGSPVSPAVASAVQTGAGATKSMIPWNILIPAATSLFGAFASKPKTSSAQSAAEQQLAQLLGLQSQRIQQASPLYEALLKWGGSLMPTRIGNPYAPGAGGSSGPARGGALAAQRSRETRAPLPY